MSVYDAGLSAPAMRWKTRFALGIALVALVAAVAWFSHHSPHQETSPAPSPSLKGATRIASLTLATDEILSELVAVDRLACVTALADDAEMSNVPGFYPARVPRLRDADPERVITLRPDLVCVAPYNSADFLKVMERSGLPVYRNQGTESVNEIELSILALGERVGEPDRARALIERMRQRRQHFEKALADVPRRPRVLYWSAGYTAGRRTTMDDVIRMAGGVNIAAERSNQGTQQIAPEAVIAADPEYILLSRWSADERQGRIENHPILRNLAAVRENRVIVIDGKYLTCVSQFVLEGAERLAVRLHPDRFTAHADDASGKARAP